MSELCTATRHLPAPGPWEPARPIGTRWMRLSNSVRLLASVAGLATGGRTTR